MQGEPGLHIPLSFGVALAGFTHGDGPIVAAAVDVFTERERLAPRRFEPRTGRKVGEVAERIKGVGLSVAVVDARNASRGRKSKHGECAWRKLQRGSREARWVSKLPARVPPLRSTAK